MNIPSPLPFRDVVGPAIWPNALRNILAQPGRELPPPDAATDAYAGTDTEIHRQRIQREGRSRRPAPPITFRRATQATTTLQREATSLTHVRNAAALALNFDGNDGWVEIQVEFLRLSLLTQVPWPTLIAHHGEAARRLLTELVFEELKLPLKYTLPIMQPELLKFLPAEILPRLLGLTLRRIKAVALNLDKTLALQSFSSFERYSLRTADLFLPNLMEEAARLLCRSLVPEATQEVLTRVLGKYYLNREEYKLYTEILARQL